MGCGAVVASIFVSVAVVAVVVEEEVGKGVEAVVGFGFGAIGFTTKPVTVSGHGVAAVVIADVARYQGVEVDDV